MDVYQLLRKRSMKNNIKITLSIVALLIVAVTYGQQDPLYTQYANNFSLINPAYAGSHGQFTATAAVRSQWAGEPGSPETKSLSIHGPMGKNVGLGLSVVNDKVFVLNETHVYADFSYAIYPSDNSTFAFGLKAGGSFLDVDLLSLGIENDDLFSENLNEFNPNIGTGAYYYTDKLYVSVSLMNILKSNHYNKESKVVSSATDAFIYYASAGYIFNLSESLQLKPSFLVRGADGSPFTTDVTASVLWNSKLEFGISHRIHESIAGIFQIRLTDNLKIGYSYDAITNELSNYNNGSHEFSLILNLGKKNANRSTPFFWMKDDK